MQKTALLGSVFALDYPPVKRDEKVEEEFFGTKVRDPYRWLERPNSNEVAEFVDVQNDLTFNYLNECPDRQQIRERLTELWKYPKYGKPEKRGSRYFYYAQESGKELLNVQDQISSQPRVILDSEESGAMIFPHLGVSKDGEVLVYRELIKRKSGSPKLTGSLRVKNITSDHLYPDLIEGILYPQIAWTRDSNGFFYFSHVIKTDYREFQARAVDNVRFFYSNKVVLGYTSDASGSGLRELTNGTLIRLFPLKYGELLTFSSDINSPEVLFRSQTLEGLPELTVLDTSQEKATMQPLIQNPALSGYDPTLFTFTKVTFPVDDDESEEMVIIHRKDIKLDGSSYAFLVEREFDIDFYFRLFFAYMKDYNAVIAIPNVQDADGTYKDSALDDFIASSKYLIKNGYTSPSKLITRGTGVFGLFTAAAANRNPELYGAVIPYMVGFDMVRFPTFSNWSVAATPSDKDTFQRLLGVSPLHNVRLPAKETVQYPSIFIPTPDNEFPVIFAFKYISELQYILGRNARQTNPFLIRVVSEQHDHLRNFARYHIDRETDIRCFLGRTVGLRLPAS